jgi:hypothetical protein
MESLSLLVDSFVFPLPVYEGHEPLYLVAKRYRLGGAENGITLLFAHATGSRKHSFLPSILIRSLITFYGHR